MHNQNNLLNIAIKCDDGVCYNFQGINCKTVCLLVSFNGLSFNNVKNADV